MISLAYRHPNHRSQQPNVKKETSALWPDRCVILYTTRTSFVYINYDIILKKLSLNNPDWTVKGSFQFTTSVGLNVEVCCTCEHTKGKRFNMNFLRHCVTLINLRNHFKNDIQYVIADVIVGLSSTAFWLHQALHTIRLCITLRHTYLRNQSSHLAGYCISLGSQV